VIDPWSVIFDVFFGSGSPVSVGRMTGASALVGYSKASATGSVGTLTGASALVGRPKTSATGSVGTLTGAAKLSGVSGRRWPWLWSWPSLIEKGLYPWE